MTAANSLSPTEYMTKYGREYGIFSEKTVKRWAEGKHIEGTKVDGRWRLLDQTPISIPKKAPGAIPAALAAAKEEAPVKTPAAPQGAPLDQEEAQLQAEERKLTLKLSIVTLKNKIAEAENRLNKPEELAKREAAVVAKELAAAEKEERLTLMEKRLNTEKAPLLAFDQELKNWRNTVNMQLVTFKSGVAKFKKAMAANLPGLDKEILADIERKFDKLVPTLQLPELPNLSPKSSKKKKESAQISEGNTVTAYDKPK